MKTTKKWTSTIPTSKRERCGAITPRTWISKNERGLKDRFGLLFFAFLLAACAGFRSGGDSDDLPQNVDAEEVLLSDFRYYYDQGIQLAQDSLWFEASDRLDSALSALKALDSLEFPTDAFKQKQAALKDSLYKYMIQCAFHESQMQIVLPWQEIWDEAMEQVSDSQIVKVDSLAEEVSPTNYTLPLTMPLRPKVQQAMAVLLGAGRSYFSKWLNRKTRYEKMIYRELDARDMPKDLIYLAMVESGFNPRAWSRAKASGIWQFIRGTGKRYGLHDDWWIDERRDPEKATRAALTYLQELYEEFQDWHLAMAAYNCGENRIRRRLREDSTQTYWDMQLPRETMNYIPKILAAMIIGENPEHYDFVVEPQASLAYDTATVEHTLSLSVIAKLVKSDEEIIRELNPELKRWSTPPSREGYVLRVPKGSRKTFLANYRSLDKSTLVNWHRHRVRKGENLGLIGMKYGVSVHAIKSTNNLRGNLIHIGQRLLIPIPASEGNKRASKGSGKKADPPRKRVVKDGTYRVRSGDNLYDIAQSLQVPLARLLQANGLHRRSVIQPGQTLVVPRDGHSSTAPQKRLSQYRVRSGDNLWTIARRLQTTVPKLKQLNGLSGNRLKVGQVLKYEQTGGGDSYIVQSNDTLWDIAKKHGTSVEKLRELNPELPAVLKPGMRIRLR